MTEKIETPGIDFVTTKQTIREINDVIRGMKDGDPVHPNHICRVSDCRYRKTISRDELRQKIIERINDYRSDYNDGNMDSSVTIDQILGYILLDINEMPMSSQHVVGNDCPKCGKKGTVFKYIEDDGGLTMAYVCCRSPSVSPEGLIYPPGHPRQVTQPQSVIDAAPVITSDLKEVLLDLVADQYRLDQIRQALGIAPRDQLQRIAGRENEIANLLSDLRDEREKHRKQIEELLASTRRTNTNTPTPR